MGRYFLEEVKEFVEGYVDSFVEWDLIVFFYSNPQIKADIPTLAARLGREEKTVRPAVKSLTAKGILREGAKGTFEYHPSGSTAIQIEKFVSALETTEGRLSVLLCVLEKISKRRKRRTKLLS
jgi:hypothetical protein